MKLAVFRIDIVYIIRSNESDVMFFRQATKRAIDLLLFRKSMILNLQEEIISAKDAAVLTHQRIGKLHVPTQNRLRYLSCHTGRQGNQPFMEAPKKLLIDARLIIISLDVGEGYELNQIAIAAFIFCKQNQMIVSRAVYLGTLLPLTRGKVDLTTDDGMNALRLGLLIKCNSSIHNTVIGHGDRIHAEFLRPTYKLFNAACTIQQAVLCMYMQMRKGH